MVDIANLSADLGIPMQVTGKQILGAATTKAIKDLSTGTSIGRYNLLGSGSGAVLGGIIGSPIGAIHGYKKAIRKEIKRRHQNP